MKLQYLLGACSNRAIKMENPSDDPRDFQAAAGIDDDVFGADDFMRMLS